MDRLAIFEDGFDVRAFDLEAGSLDEAPVVFDAVAAEVYWCPKPVGLDCTRVRNGSCRILTREA
jgi:hypothetical protein